MLGPRRARSSKVLILPLLLKQRERLLTARKGVEAQKGTQGPVVAAEKPLSHSRKLPSTT